MSFLGFGAPLVLIALAVLPLIWFLLRATPPRPSQEPFPPLNILRQIVQEEQTAHKTPWWLVLLRLILAGLIIFALAQPLLNPRQLLVSDRAPLILMIDNGFAALPRWQNRLDTAQKLIQEAEAQDLPVTIIATADPANTEIGSYRGNQAREVLASLSPQPIFPNRDQAIDRLIEDVKDASSPPQIAYLSDGLAGERDEDLSRLTRLTSTPLLWYQGAIDGLVGLRGVENGVEAMRVMGLRASATGQASYNVAAYDGRGRRLGETEMIFEQGERQAQAEFALPLEMRNDIISLRLEDVTSAAATYLTSSRDKRRRIAILSVGRGEMVQPLITPLYYPMQALAPFGDLIQSNKTTMGEQIEQLLDANPALLVMGDEAMIPPQNRGRVMRWLEAGGTLLRFSGPRLAASTMDDGLLPVRLRRGERTMGGVMSWADPQKIAPIPRQSPLFGLEVPENITVSRQILAEPEPQLFDKSWLNLADGTPLVTAQTRGRGRIVLIHTTASPDWSDLALSGFFVEMLQRFVLNANTPLLQAEATTDTASLAESPPLGEMRRLPPWRTLNSDGQLLPPPAFVLPLEVDQFDPKRPDFYHPPGLYGSAEGEQVALNLLEATTQFEPLSKPEAQGALDIISRPYEEENNLPLEGILWALALILFTLDCLIMMLLGRQGTKQGTWRNFFSQARAKKARSVASAMIMVLFALSFSFQPQTGQAQANEEDAQVLAAAKTHLAYVITGNRELDNLSRAGLEALSQFITARTTIEPADVAGVDLSRDELSFYPLLYWPIEATSTLPSDEAIARLDSYMRQGGSVLFDTRDQLESGLNLDGTPTANGAHLRRILENLDIPPLEPAPSEHVVARSFYIMPDFPGRYRGSDLWLEALPLTAIDDSGILSTATPIVRSGDGVSPILITANDFIGAWARNATDDWFYPTVPDDPSQRLWAFRGGLNIIMYMLSGNYKADQVHAPELLQRLGN